MSNELLTTNEVAERPAMEAKRTKTDVAKLATLEYWTPREVADHLGLHVSTVHRNLHERSSPDEEVPAGKIPAVRVGGCLRIHESVVNDIDLRAKQRATVKAVALIRHREKKYRRTSTVDHFAD